jgi:hypothetical protein
MGPLRDIRIGKLPLLLLACISAFATYVIIDHGGQGSSAQLAALAALHERPAKVPASSASLSGSAGSSGSVGGSGGGSASGGGSSGGGASSASASAGSSDGGSSDSGSSASTGDGSTGSGSTDTTTTGTDTTTTPTNTGLPAVHHVFLLALSTPSYKDAFGKTSQAPYLRALAAKGTVLTGFHSLGSSELPDLLAMVSGQAPNSNTKANCSKYVPFPQSATVSTAGIAAGHGCVYPDGALTIADQATSAGDSWGGYVDDLGTQNCPVPNTDGLLSTPLVRTQEGYDLLHNPFAFFGSLLDAGGCSEYDQDLSKLTHALAHKSATPTFTYVGPDACSDGDPQIAPAVTDTTTTGTGTTGTTATGTTTGTGTSATTTGTTTATGTTSTGTTTATGTTSTGTTTATGTTTGTTTSTGPYTPPAVGCPAGQQSGIAAEDAFLKSWVPKILASAAYRANGVLVIAFTGDGGHKSARTGALVLSHWTPRGHKLSGSYTPYSLLHSLEDMLDYQPLAHAATAPAFAKAVL